MRNINFLEQSLPKHIMNKIPLLKVKVYVRYLTRVAIVSVRCNKTTSRLMEKKIKHIIMKYGSKHGIHFGYSGSNEYKTKLFIGYGSVLDYDFIADRNLSQVPIVDVEKPLRQQIKFDPKPLRLLQTLIDVVGLELEIPQAFIQPEKENAI